MQSARTPIPRLSGLLALALCLASAATADTMTAASMLSDIKARGARAVFKSIENTPRWDEVLTHVESGERQWLKVAVMLYSATDAGDSEMLTLAAGVALLRRPRDVLIYAAPTLGIQFVCGQPVEGDPGVETPTKLLAYLDARIAAVSRLTGVDVAAARTSCLKYLTEARSQAASSNGL